MCPATRVKHKLFLLYLRFEKPMDSPFQHPGMDFHGEAEECDFPIVGAHSQVW